MARLDLVRDLVTFSSQHEHIGSSYFGASVDALGRAPTCESRFENNASTARWSLLLSEAGMGIVRRNKAFLITAALILVVGAALFGGVVAVRVFAAASDTPAAAASRPGLVQHGQQLRHHRLRAAQAHADRRDPVLHHLAPRGTARHRPSGVRGRRRRRHGDAAATSTTSRRSTAPTARSCPSRRARPRAGRHARSSCASSNPPILAVIRGNGEVAELYTGWIGLKVMEQVVADAVRGL